MVSKIFLFIAIANILFLNEFANSFVYYNSLNTLNNLNMRFIGDISRRNLLELIPSSVVPAIVHPKYVFAYKGEPQNTNLLNKINKVAVFGASGYTGGDTVRTLINKNINVVAITRRNVEIVDRENAKINTLVIDDIKDKDKIKKITGVDVLKPSTLSGILYGCDAVIFCAASRPSVKITGTPGTDAYDKMINENITKNEIAEPSSDVEDIGLVNVAKEAIKSNVKKLIIVSSICAKCQLGKENYGETIDRGFASCDACYKKQTGEERIRILYKNNPKNLSYTIVRPGMLSPGEKRGYKEVEFNQGISKSGIISRIDLADVLVSAVESDNSARKTFEVYYKDTAQPIDMFKSLKTCKEMGKSVKECFFGEGYNDTSPLSIDKMLNTSIKGTIFPSGQEVSGEVYPKMFKYLKEDIYENYDISVLMSKDII